MASRPPDDLPPEMPEDPAPDADIPDRHPADPEAAAPLLHDLQAKPLFHAGKPESA